jgi:hypothetical protein
MSKYGIDIYIYIISYIHTYIHCGITPSFGDVLGAKFGFPMPLFWAAGWCLWHLWPVLREILTWCCAKDNSSRRHWKLHSQNWCQSQLGGESIESITFENWSWDGWLSLPSQSYYTRLCVGWPDLFLFLLTLLSTLFKRGEGQDFGDFPARLLMTQ